MVGISLLLLTIVIYVYLMNGFMDVEAFFRVFKHYFNKFKSAVVITALDEWDITDIELTKIIKANPSLRGMILGYVAEYKLAEHLRQNPHVSSVQKADDHDRKRKGDLLVVYKGVEFRIESKSLQTNSVEREAGVCRGTVQCDASDKRKIKLDSGDEVETTCLKVGTFDVLSANLFAFNNKWDFAFALNSDLPRSKFKKYSKEVREQLLKTSIPVSLPLDTPFVSSPFDLFDSLINDKTK